MDSMFVFPIFLAVGSKGQHLTKGHSILKIKMAQKNSQVLRIQPDGPPGVRLDVLRKISGPSDYLGQAIFLFPIDTGCIVRRSRKGAPFTVGDHRRKNILYSYVKNINTYNTLKIKEKYLIL